MKLFERKQYIIGIIIIVLALVLAILNSNGQCEDKVLPFSVVSQEYGPLTYVVEIRKESASKTKYHHLIGRTGYELSLVGITNTLPNEQVLHRMLLKYMLIITNGGV